MVFTRENIIRGFLLTCAVILFGVNLGGFARDLVKTSLQRQKTPYTFLGFKFAGLEEILGSQRVVGYYTDRSLDDQLTAMQFAQAQYVLAPTVLDLNNTGHTYTLFACADPRTSALKIRETGLTPIKANLFGIILTRKPATPPKTTEPTTP